MIKTQYLPKFLKDLKALQSAPSFEAIKALVFDEIPNLPSFEGIINLKKLKGEDNAYRIRVGDYRVGFFWDGETIKFARVLHRKDIYRHFP